MGLRRVGRGYGGLGVVIEGWLGLRRVRCGYGVGCGYGRLGGVTGVGLRGLGGVTEVWVGLQEVRWNYRGLNVVMWGRVGVRDPLRY